MYPPHLKRYVMLEHVHCMAIQHPQTEYGFTVHAYGTHHCVCVCVRAEKHATNPDN